MILIVYSSNFLISAERLPRNIRRKLARLIILLQKKPFFSLLHTKPLSGELAGLFSFRITRDWRVMFQFLNPRAIQLLRVAHRKDMYR